MVFLNTRERGGGVLGLIFAVCMCCWSLTDPNPIIVYFVAIDPILVTFRQICNFRDPNLVIFYLCIYLINFFK